MRRHRPGSNGWCMPHSCSWRSITIKQHQEIDKTDNMQKMIFLGALVLTFAACNGHKLVTDASGVFESDEVIVSAEQNGKITSFPIHEGDTLAAGKAIGQIDMSNTILQK